MRIAKHKADEAGWRKDLRPIRVKVTQEIDVLEVQKTKRGLIYRLWRYWKLALATSDG